MIEIEKALRQAVDPFRLSSSLKNRHRPGWRFLLFTTKPSVIVFRPTWKVNVKRMVLTSSRKWGQPPAVVCSACCRCSLKSTSHFVTQCNKLLQPHHKLWATPHNSKCQYGERGAADAKPKAQIILDAAKVSAASGGDSEPKQGQRSQSARGFCPRSTMRVPQPDIIEHFGNADAVPPPKRCLSRKAGIVRCCLKNIVCTAATKAALKCDNKGQNAE